MLNPLLKFLTSTMPKQTDTVNQVNWFNQEDSFDFSNFDPKLFKIHNKMSLLFS